MVLYNLQGRSRNGEFSHLPAADAYFDDQQHYQHIRHDANVTV